MRGGQTRSHVTSLTNSSQNSSCLVFILLSSAGSQGQQSKQRHLLQPSEEDLPQGLLAVAEAWNRPGGVQRPSWAGSSSLTGLLTLSVRDAQPPCAANSSRLLVSTIVAFRPLPRVHQQELRALTATAWIGWRVSGRMIAMS